MTPETIKTFFNQTFFDNDGNARQGTIAMAFRSEYGEVIIPIIQALPTATLEEILRGYRDFLLSQPTQGLQPVSIPQTAIADVADITYRDNTYRVQLLTTGVAEISNYETGAAVSTNSPTGKAILKLYRESKKTEA